MHKWFGVLTDVSTSAANSLFCTVDGHVAGQKIGNAWTINKDKFAMLRNVLTLLFSLIKKPKQLYIFFKYPAFRRPIFMICSQDV